MQLESPRNPGAVQEVDETHAAARVSLRPFDHRDGSAHIGGHYRTVLTTGATTLIAAGGSLLACRWTNPDRSLLLHRIRAWATIGTVFTTAQEVSIHLARVVNFTAADTGGTLVDIGESCRKARPTMRASGIGNLRVAGAGALTPGTGVEEVPCGAMLFTGLLNAVGSMAGGELFNCNAGEEHPLVIGSLEGLRINIRTAMGAAGVVVFTFELDWAEVPTAMFEA